MPRKPTNNTVTSIGDVLDGNEKPDGINELPPGDDDLGDSNDLFNDVERVCAEVGSTTDSATINIFRVDPDKRNPDAFLMSTTPKEFSLERVLYEYGGGKYRIRGYHPREFGGVRMFVNRIVVLEEPKRRLNEVIAQPSSNTNEILAAIAEMNRNNQEVIKAFMQSAQKDPKESRSDFLREMMLMKEIFSQPHENAPHQNPISMLKDVMELQTHMKAFSGEGGDSNGSAMSMLGFKLLEKLGDLASANKPQTQSPPVSNALLYQYPPNPVHSPLSQLPQPSSNTSEDEQMKAMLGEVIKAAESGDPKALDFWAGAFYDQAPDELLEQLISNPLWFQGLKMYDSRVASHENWFKQLRDKVIEMDTQLTDQESSDKLKENTVPTSNVPTSQT